MIFPSPTDQRIVVFTRFVITTQHNTLNKWFSILRLLWRTFLCSNRFLSLGSLDDLTLARSGGWHFEQTLPRGYHTLHSTLIHSFTRITALGALSVRLKRFSFNGRFCAESTSSQFTKLEGRCLELDVGFGRNPLRQVLHKISSNFHRFGSREHFLDHSRAGTTGGKFSLPYCLVRVHSHARNPEEIFSGIHTTNTYTRNGESTHNSTTKTTGKQRLG